MVPPSFLYGDWQNPNSRIEVSLNAPLDWWFKFGEYNSRSLCEAARAKSIQDDAKLEDNFLKTKPPNELQGIEEMHKHALCIATDDPRLKGK
jgi:hypothetical protein